MGTRVQRVATAVFAGSLCLTACGGGSDESVADPPVASPTALASSSAEPSATASSGVPNVDPELAAQLLQDVADAIDETAKGYAQVLQNVAKRKVTIYWKGTPPQDVRDLEGTTSTGVEVVIVQAKLSKADVDAAIQRISQAASSGRLPKPDSISANRDFSAIEVGFADSRFVANNNASVRGKFSDVAKVPVAIVRAAQHAPD